MGPQISFPGNNIPIPMLQTNVHAMTGSTIVSLQRHTAAFDLRPNCELPATSILIAYDMF